MSKTLLALILASSSVAAADSRVAVLDDSTAETPATTPAAAPAANAYVAVGAAAGADSSVDWVYGATTLDGGYRLNDKWWVRARLDRSARIGSGPVNRPIELQAPDHAHTDAMVGIELRKCRSEELCGTVGSDVGYRFSNDDYVGGFAMAPRIGLDFGEHNLRIRPGIEGNMSFIHARGPYSGEPALQGIYFPALSIGFTTSIAYQF